MLNGFWLVAKLISRYELSKNPVQEQGGNKFWRKMKEKNDFESETVNNFPTYVTG